MSVDASVGEELDGVAHPRENAGTPPIDEVFDAHAAYVGRTLRCLGVRELELADAIQEVFLVVHRRLTELRDPNKLKGWLYAICVRKAMALRRTAARRRERPMAEVPEGSFDKTPEDDFVRARALEVAIEILGDLDEDKRAIFVLYEVEQLPMSEVAEALGCPLQTAYSRLYAARKEIARTLQRLKANGRVER